MSSVNGCHSGPCEIKSAGKSFKPLTPNLTVLCGFSLKRAADIFICAASHVARFLGGFSQKETSRADNHK